LVLLTTIDDVVVLAVVETECKRLPRKLWCGCCCAVVVGRSFRALNTSSRLPAHKARMRRKRSTSISSPRVALLLSRLFGRVMLLLPATFMLLAAGGCDGVRCCPLSVWCAHSKLAAMTKLESFDVRRESSERRRSKQRLATKPYAESFWASVMASLDFTITCRVASGRKNIRTRQRGVCDRQLKNTSIVILRARRAILARDSSNAHTVHACDGG